MGPVWDFDTAFGNNYTRTTKPAEGFYIMKYASWYKRLFQDPVFVKRAKERFSFFYENKDLIYNDMSESAEYIKRSIIENNNRWNNLYVQNFRHQEIWGGYYNEVQYLKNWLDRRFEWFKNELGNNW